MSETTYSCPSCGERAISTAHSCASTPGAYSTAGPQFVGLNATHDHYSDECPTCGQRCPCPAPSPSHAEVDAAFAERVYREGFDAGYDAHDRRDVDSNWRLSAARRSASPSPGAVEACEDTAFVAGWKACVFTKGTVFEALAAWRGAEGGRDA